MSDEQSDTRCLSVLNQVSSAHMYMVVILYYTTVIVSDKNFFMTNSVLVDFDKIVA